MVPTCPVLCYHHDGSDSELVSEPLDDFMNSMGKQTHS
jgi:hypothetical protein